MLIKSMIFSEKQWVNVPASKTVSARATNLIVDLREKQTPDIVNITEAARSKRADFEMSQTQFNVIVLLGLPFTTYVGLLD